MPIAIRSHDAAPDAASVVPGEPGAAPAPMQRPELKLDVPRMNGPAVHELQRLLVEHGRWEVGTPDRVFGEHTDRAVRAFQQQKGLTVDGVVGADTWMALLGGPANPTAAPPAGRQRSGTANPSAAMPGHRTLEAVMASGYDLSTKTGTVAAIRQECGEHGLSGNEQIAYVLATIQHETNNTFRPVKEAYYIGNEAKAEKFRRSNNIIRTYYPFYGRGYIQLTHDYNYRKYGNWLGLDLLSRPERVCEPPIALFIAIHGLRWGTFTTQRLDRYINDQGCDFLGARRCVNAMDKAEHIAGIAGSYLDKLKSGAV